MIHIKRSRYPDQLRNRAFQHTQEPQTLRIVLYLFGLARRYILEISNFRFDNTTMDKIIMLKVITSFFISLKRQIEKSVASSKTGMLIGMI